MKTILLALVCIALFLCGCEVADKAAGIDPATGEKVGPSVAERVAPLAPMGGPWGEIGVGALGLLTTLYTLFRQKKYRKAALSVVSGGKDVLQALEDGKITKDEAIALLKKRQETDGTRDVVRKLLKEV